jgi:hypothetical protein
MQEKRGFLFCKEDRAILCRECDAAVHTASDLATRHARYLLTGVRISSEPAASPAPPSQEDENAGSFCCSGGDDDTAPQASSGSSISEYLTKTLPGWHVEDFLVDDATAAAAASAAGSSYQVGATESLVQINALDRTLSGSILGAFRIDKSKNAARSGHVCIHITTPRHPVQPFHYGDGL